MAMRAAVEQIIRPTAEPPGEARSGALDTAGSEKSGVLFTVVAATRGPSGGNNQDPQSPPTLYAEPRGLELAPAYSSRGAVIQLTTAPAAALGGQITFDNEPIGMRRFLSISRSSAGSRPRVVK